MTDKLRECVNKYLSEIAKGNEIALDDLACLISGRMLSIANSILHDSTLAQDCVQDCFIKIVQKAHTITPNTNGYAWVCKIVKNTSLNILRAEKRHRGINIEDCFSLASPDDPYDRATNSIVLGQAMSELTKIEQVIIYQKYFMDYSIRDIAKDIGKSKSNVQRMMVIAEEKLKSALQKGTKDDL